MNDCFMAACSAFAIRLELNHVAKLTIIEWHFRIARRFCYFSNRGGYRVVKFGFKIDSKEILSKTRKTF